MGSLRRHLPDHATIMHALTIMYLETFENSMSKLVAASDAERWHDPISHLVEAIGDIYRSEPGFRALWHNRFHDESVRQATRTHKLWIAADWKTVLCAQLLASQEAARVDAVSRTAQLMTDALLREAFQIAPSGDRNLLQEAKTALRGYLNTYVTEAGN
ncbi:TetR/AcrR family transcriptional regulator [Nocardia sp. NPDC059246]|uniref:TetR/AcrR family transcriptional regulator n=1 Tax=unclassified Nocardia TaxID=2637762 RepID=UPI003689F742